MNKLYITIPYSHDEITYNMEILMNSSVLTENKKSMKIGNKIKIQCCCSSKIILSFIENAVSKINGSSIKFNGRTVKSTLVYNISVESGNKKKGRECYWVSSENITNKSLTNTILSNHVKQNLARKASYKNV